MGIEDETVISAAYRQLQAPLQEYYEESKVFCKASHPEISALAEPCTK
jgi:hypothetical protein